MKSEAPGPNMKPGQTDKPEYLCLLGQSEAQEKPSEQLRGHDTYS